MREFTDLCEEYGERFDRSDIEPVLEEQGAGSREPVKRPKVSDRVSSSRLRKLADNHRGEKCVAILKVDSREYEGWSSGRSASDLDSRAVKHIHTHSPGHALGCAEFHCISQAYQAEYREKTKKVARREHWHRDGARRQVRAGGQGMVWKGVSCLSEL